MTIPLVKRDDALAETEKNSDSAEAWWGNVPCRYGVICHSFPIAGMRLGDVRVALKVYLNLDPDAVATVNGRRLSEDDLIGDGVECLTFIKPFSLKA